MGVSSLGVSLKPSDSDGISFGLTVQCQTISDFFSYFLYDATAPVVWEKLMSLNLIDVFKCVYCIPLGTGFVSFRVLRCPRYTSHAVVYVY